MERAFVVLLTLASIMPAAEPPESKHPATSKRRLTPKPAIPTLSASRHNPREDCAVMTNNLGSAYFSTGKYRGGRAAVYARDILVELPTLLLQTIWQRHFTIWERCIARKGDTMTPRGSTYELWTCANHWPGLTPFRCCPF